MAHLDYFTDNIYASDVQPETTPVNSVWYDTANNKMFTTVNGGLTWIESIESLPFAFVLLKTAYQNRLTKYLMASVISNLQFLLYPVSNVLSLMAKMKMEV